MKGDDKYITMLEDAVHEAAEVIEDGVKGLRVNYGLYKAASTMATEITVEDLQAIRKIKPHVSDLIIDVAREVRKVRKHYAK